jgi:hypothetical protein
MPSNNHAGSDDPNETAPLVLSGGDNHGRAVARTGQLIELTLQTIGVGNFGEPEVSSAAVRFLGTPPAKQHSPGGPRQVYRFEAVEAGAARIEIPHTAGQESFAIDIEVK